MKNYMFVGLFGIYFAALFLFGPLWVTDTRVGWGWVVLTSLAFVLAAGAVFFRPQFRMPPKNISYWLLGFLALACVFSLFNGSTLLEERWTHRWVWVLFFFGLLQWFQNPKELAAALRYPLLLFVLALCAEAVYQSFFVCPTSTLATSCFSSRFYNINMLTQALLIAIVLLNYFKEDAAQKTRWLIHAAITASLFVIVYSQSRSAWLAVSIFTLSRLFISRKEFLRFFLPLAVAMVAFKFDPRATAGINPPNKAVSTQYRMELVTGTLRMIAESPLGAGMNNFEFGFIPFRNEGTLEPTVVSVDKTPHSDVLLVPAEEGWLVGFVFLAGLGLLIFKAAKLLWAGSRALWPSFLLIMLPEIFFQFPSDMHFFAFALAMVLAVESLHLPGPEKVSTPLAKTGVFVLAFLISAAGLVRYNTFADAKFSPLYCSLFHDAWKNCGFYFNYHLQRADISRAEKTIVPVLKYQKFNYVMHHWDYLLYNPERNPVIACNYAALLKFEISIPTSDISRCERGLSRSELTRRIENYSRTR